MSNSKRGSLTTADGKVHDPDGNILAASKEESLYVKCEHDDWLCLYSGLHYVKYSKGTLVIAFSLVTVRFKCDQKTADTCMAELRNRTLKRIDHNGDGVKGLKVEEMKER